MTRPLRIAYITGEDPENINAWSGTLYYLKKSLQDKGCEVQQVGPAKPVILHYTLAVLNRISLVLFNKRFDYRHSAIYSKAYAKIFDSRLAQMEYDVALCVGGSEFTAYLQSTKPVILVVDRTIAGAINYHSILTGLWGWSERQSIETDRKAMRKSLLTVFASDWAKDSAINEYKLAPTNAITLPFGANLNSLPDRNQIDKRLDDCSILKLLFIGREWHSKGGPIALECLQLIRSKGYSAELHVVGCELPEGADKTGIIEYGFLNKNIPSEMAKLSQLYFTCHFFILPTTFEAYGLVFVESAAHGLPAIGPNTGGVASAMASGKTGVLVNKASPPNVYAEKIIELWSNKNAYRVKIEEARAEFENNLNWDVWTSKFLETLHSIQVFNNDR